MHEQRMKLNANVKWQSRKLIALWSISHSRSGFQLFIPIHICIAGIFPNTFTDLWSYGKCAQTGVDWLLQHVCRGF